MKTLFVAGFTFALAASAACAEEIKTYSDPKDGVELQYPSDWQLREDFGGTVVALGVPEGQQNPVAGETVIVAVQTVEAPLNNLETYTKLTEGHMMAEPGSQFVESKDIRLGKVPAHRAVSTATVNGVPMKFLQVWALKGDKAFIASYAAPQESYDKFSKQAEQIIASLRLI